MRRWLAAVAAAGLAAVATSAEAYETTSGHISYVYMSSPGFAAFRIALDTPLTSCLGNFVAVDTSFGNYQAYVSGLLSAQAQGKAINILYSVRPDGYCQLLEYGFG